jgi:dihydroxy-acid dehydratase
MGSLHAIGGVPIVMKELLRAGLLHGDVMTVTGKTLAENLADVPTLEQIARRTSSGRCPSRSRRRTTTSAC